MDIFGKDMLSFLKVVSSSSQVQRDDRRMGSRPDPHQDGGTGVASHQAFCTSFEKYPAFLSLKLKFD